MSNGRLMPMDEGPNVGPIVMIPLTHADDGTGRYIDQGWRTMLDARRIESIEELKPAEQIAGIVAKVVAHIQNCLEGHRGLNFDRPDLHSDVARAAAEAALEVLHSLGVSSTVSYITMQSGQAHTVVESIDEIGELMSLALNPQMTWVPGVYVGDEQSEQDDGQAVPTGFAEAAEYFNRMGNADPNNPETLHALRDSSER